MIGLLGKKYPMFYWEAFIENIKHALKKEGENYIKDNTETYISWLGRHLLPLD